MSDTEHMHLFAFIKHEIDRLDSIENTKRLSEFGKGYYDGKRVLLYGLVGKFLSKNEMDEIFKEEK